MAPQFIPPTPEEIEAWQAYYAATAEARRIYWEPLPPRPQMERVYELEQALLIAERDLSRARNWKEAGHVADPGA